VKLVAHLLSPAGAVPNHPRWPLLIYRDAVKIAGADPAVAFEELFARNLWPPAWRNGVFSHHHFHSNSHEALGVYAGEVTVLFGGDGGVALTATVGDVIVLPAGTGHKKLASRGALGVVGAYPQGSDPDTCTPELATAARRAATVARAPLPACDPVYGDGGPLFTHWR
jgi:uncharacterized protein YjlB